MLSPSERRQAIIEAISERRYETIDNLALEFSVCRNTIKRDLTIISSSVPIYTVKGRTGGVRAHEDWYASKEYLTKEQELLLSEILPHLDIEREYIMRSIIDKYRMPRVTGK